LKITLAFIAIYTIHNRKKKEKRKKREEEDTPTIPLLRISTN